MSTGVYAIICDDMNEFNSIAATIQSGLIANLPEYSAEKWADPLVHPTSGAVALPTKSRCEPYLTQAQLDRIEELPESWFPAPE